LAGSGNFPAITAEIAFRTGDEAGCAAVAAELRTETENSSNNGGQSALIILTVLSAMNYYSPGSPYLQSLHISTAQLWEFRARFPGDPIQ
jgi:hypothetical protein